MFPFCEKYSVKLEQIVKERGINVHYKNVLTKIDKNNRKATFKDLDTEKITQQDFDFLHMVPNQSAPKALADSPLAAENGYAAVNHETLQHLKYANVFALGDCANLPTSKTAAAAFG